MDKLEKDVQAGTLVGTLKPRCPNLGRSLKTQHGGSFVIISRWPRRDTVHTDVVLLSVTDIETTIRNGPQYVQLGKARTEVQVQLVNLRVRALPPPQTGRQLARAPFCLSQPPSSPLPYLRRSSPTPQAVAAHRLTHQHLKSAGQVSLQAALQG